MTTLLSKSIKFCETSQPLCLFFYALKFNSLNYKDLELAIKNSSKTRGAISEEIGISRNGLKKMIDNKTYSLENYIKLCDALGVSPCEFFSCGTSDSVLAKKVHEQGKELEHQAQLIDIYKKMTAEMSSHIETLTGKKIGGRLEQYEKDEEANKKIG